MELARRRERQIARCAVHLSSGTSGTRSRAVGRWFRSRFLAAAVAAVTSLGAVAAAPVAAQAEAGPAGGGGGPAAQWTMGGHDLDNTRSNPAERKIDKSNADELIERWRVTTKGDVSATPAVVDGAVYFPDWGGTFWKVDAKTGAVIWSRQLAEYLPDVDEAVSRTSPVVVGKTVYIGSIYGATLLAIDVSDGDLRWSSKLDEHPWAVLTQSPVVYDGVLYQGISSYEEVAAIDPAYDCCTFRGSMKGVDAKTGEVLWSTDTIVDQGSGSADIFSGAAVWGSTPAIDPATHTVYITTGNNYEIPKSAQECQAAGGTPKECLPEWNRINSLIALDMRTGKIKWTTGQDRFDSWNGGCLPGLPPNNCPVVPGPDHDFGDGAHLFTLRDADGHRRRAVGAGQKSGEYWMLDAATGEVLWKAAVGPGSELGGIEWGTASDGKRVYFTETNMNALPYQLPNGETITYSSFGALDVNTGRILWQVAEPHQGKAIGAVSVANGVVYAGSLNNHMYALDAATGEVLWDYEGEGGSGAGPSIVDGFVYWGNGYVRVGGTEPSTTFYAFSLPKRS